jgi:hypothetical protein
MLKITLHPTSPKYVNAKGNVVFRYNVSGTPEALAEYKLIKGEFYREDEKTKTPLLFTTRGIGAEGTILKTADNKDYVIDDSEEAMFASLVKQYGVEWACIKMNKPMPNQLVVKEIPNTGAIEGQK